MTTISRVTIHGFKSFAHKTDILFDTKYNCILGPNGSGKSNVGDALCFVLGRLSAKSMRAEKAANLIFNGGKGHKPASSGTVEIEFDNSNGTFTNLPKKVVISRTITKKGSSIYRINGKKQTRTNILDLLSQAHVNPDGYNIVLQGDITRFVDLPSVKRREIVEQISDVAHYEDKKKKALQELSKAEEKLHNASIILKERAAHLKELKKDRDQALKFKEIKDKIGTYKASYLHKKITALASDKESYDKKIGTQEAAIAKANEEIESLKQTVDQLRSEILKINEEIEASGEKGQVSLHKEIESLKTTVIEKKTRVSTLTEELKKITERKAQFKEEVKELSSKNKASEKRQEELQKAIARYDEQINSTQEKLGKFRSKHKLDDSSKREEELIELEATIDELQGKVQKLRLEQQELLRDKDKIEYRLETIDEQVKKVALIKKEHKDQIQKLEQQKKEFTKSTVELNKCLERDSSFASQLSNARKSLQELQEKYAKLQGRAMAAQASQSSNRAVSAIIAQKKKFSGVYGTIAQLGQVNSKYATALEMAAGSRTQNIVVDTDKTAAECISYLKSNKLGSASFIPLNKIRTMSIGAEDKALLKQDGVHNFALKLVTFKPQFKKAFEYVFAKTVVVEDLSAARRLGIGKARMVTLDGDIAEGSGVMRGGYKATKRASSFQERDSIEQLEKVEGRISEQQGVLANIELKREENDATIVSLRKHRAELEAQIITLEKTLHLDKSDLEASTAVKKDLAVELKEADKKLDDCRKLVAGLNKELAAAKSSKQMLRAAMTKSSSPTVMAQLSAFEEAKRKAREAKIAAEQELKTMQSQVQSLISPEIQKIYEIIKQHDKEYEQFSSEIVSLKKELKEQEATLKEKEKASEAFYKKYKDMFAKRETLNGKISKTQVEIEKRRERRGNHEREVNLVSLKNAEIKAKLSVLEEEFEQYKECKLITNMSEKDLYAQISRYEADLAKMSAVNMKALEIYEKVEEEYNKLVEKREALTLEKTEILTLMNEIETKKTEHFMKTFEELNKHFKVIFSKLFHKGDAFLQLNNPKKPFEDGVSIKVKITGKRHMDLKSLSGGEKTLTALAFIFAVQEFQPASFYVLDEIDAALDKHNSERLAKLVAEYSSRAQYIVISHNDSVISEADSLFGVSMRDGVSKITSLRI